MERSGGAEEGYYNGYLENQSNMYENENGDIIFKKLDFEEAFNYPDVYPDCCEANEVWYYARDSLIDDDFVCKLDTLHKLEKCTVLEEQRKYNKRANSSTNESGRKNGKKEIQYKKNKQDNTSRDIANSPTTIQQRVPRKVVPKNIQNYPIRMRATSAREPCKNIPEKRIGYKVVLSPYQNEMLETKSQPRPTTYKQNSASFQEFADNYINNSKPVQKNVPNVNKLFNRVKTVPPIRTRATSVKTKSHRWSRSKSATSRSNGSVNTNNTMTPTFRLNNLHNKKDNNSVNTNNMMTPTLRLNNLHNKKDGIKHLKNKSKFINVSVMKSNRTFITDKFPNHEISQQRSEYENKSDDEYGNTNEERALFAVTLPHVSKHYMRHMRDSLVHSNIPNSNVDDIKNNCASTTDNVHSLDIISQKAERISLKET